MHTYSNSNYIRSEFDYDRPLCCLFGLPATRLGHVASSSSLIRHSAACSDCTATQCLGRPAPFLFSKRWISSRMNDTFDHTFDF
jgi:hypothetical protein